ncbi:Uncharacterized protein dnl_30370 [Desulfonema limicola]|uniref:Uncharacterized protein n=1 Tax=Desulfonema limicola TaxID=45656 RepID=A0A975B8H2_9BACT|nr:Uncharacterized protein dnl_30370 [Desulfonema limicola]
MSFIFWPVACVCLRFQSLFSWKYNCEGNAEGDSSRDFICFNPCFHGSTTVRTFSGYKVTSAIRFQSLFSWKYNCELFL